MDNSDAIKKQVKGFLVPIFMEDSPDGERLNGLGPEDFQKVVEGYACSRCLAEFDTYTVRCPVCGLVRNLQDDLKEAPRLWTEHLRERNLDVPVEKPPVVNPFAPGAGTLPPLPEMETIPLSKLRKSKWGRG